MKLYLVQHAKAASKEVDPQRPLTEQGRKDVEKIADFIKPLNLSVANLWHSKKKRTIQTAGVLSNAVKTENPPAERDDISPNDDVKKIRREIESARQDTMIVGHLPFLPKLASLLLTGSESRDVITFKNAGIVCLRSSEDKNWQLDWHLTPELLG